MLSLLTLAAEASPKGLWYPVILGILVVVAGIVLFCGSIYVLLGTNLGARLGFLVAFTSLAGFMVLLTLLWCTTASPLNTLKGRIPQWRVEEVVASPAKAKTTGVQNINTKQNVAAATEASNVKAAVDAALVTKVSTPTVEYTPNDNRFAKFPDVTKYQILQTWEIGGSKPQFWKGEFTHTPEYAVAEFCQVKDTSGDQPFGLPPLPPECDNSPDAVKGFVVLQRDPRIVAGARVRGVRHLAGLVHPRAARAALAGAGRDGARAGQGRSCGGARPGRVRTDEGVTMLRRIRALVGLGLCTAGALLALAGPAGAQQLVDAGKEGDGSGGLAFVLMVVMVVAIGGSLFFMDHVRRNRLRQDDDTPQS